MGNLREHVGKSFCVPFGQVVLLEVTTYISESSLTLTGKQEASAISFHKVVGYGELTFSCNVNDIVEVINLEDLRYKRFGFNNEMTQLRETILDLREDLDKSKLKGSVKQLVDKADSNPNTFASWQELIKANRYVKSVNYCLTQEHNLEFKTSLDTVQFKLNRFFTKVDISVENLENIKDEYITDEFIGRYKLLKAN